MRNVIQLLILTLIGLICGGILTIGIVQVRGAAHRTQCVCNLKQLALAIANYEGTHDRFPTADEQNPDLPTENRLSWIVVILPFVEANNLYNKLDHKKSWDAEENCFAALTSVKILDCPGCVLSPTTALAPTCYVGIAGLGSDAIDLPSEDGRAGFLGYERILKREDFKNHSSSILMLAETQRLHGPWTAAGIPTTRGLLSDGSPYIGVGGQFGGNHRDGTNVAFMDGSVRLLPNNVDPALFEAMATLSGKSKRE